ncbi:hypothetical protein C2W62_42100 [Candidatus Entotheonella serta]|nr:hypothetical protein C2W62_42100 [Candidatus Entotheonella serta]
MQRNTAVFNGTDFVSGVPFETIDRYYRAFNSEFEKATRAWNRQIPSSARGTPDGLALRKRLVEAQNWAKAMAAKYPGVKAQFAKQQQAAAAAQATAKKEAAATAAQHKTQCANFQSRAMTPLNREPMIRLINQSVHGNSRIGSVDGVNAQRKLPLRWWRCVRASTSPRFVPNRVGMCSIDPSTIRSGGVRWRNTPAPIFKRQRSTTPKPLCPPRVHRPFKASIS